MENLPWESGSKETKARFLLAEAFFIDREADSLTTEARLQDKEDFSRHTEARSEDTEARSEAGRAWKC